MPVESAGTVQPCWQKMADRYAGKTSRSKYLHSSWNHSDETASKNIYDSQHDCKMPYRLATSLLEANVAQRNSRGNGQAT